MSEDQTESFPNEESIPTKRPRLHPSSQEALQKKRYYAADQYIEDTDVPERLQRAFEDRENPSSEEITKEAEWMCSQLSLEFQAVEKFLRFYRLDKLEVSFIARYKIFELEPLKKENCWELISLDQEWSFVFSQRTSKQSTLQKAIHNSQTTNLKTGDKTFPKDFLPFKDEIFSENSHYIEEFSDLDKFINCYIHTLEGPNPSNPFQALRQQNLDKFTQKAALSPYQLYQNLQADKQVHEATSYLDSPQDIAFELLGENFTEELKVLHSAAELMSAEIACFPPIRQHLRTHYQNSVKVFTEPTEKGKSELNVFHPYYRVKNLALGKDYKSFSGELWAEAKQCQTDQLIKVSFEARKDSVFKKLKKAYLSKETSDSTKQWNLFRTEVLKQALESLYKSFQEELQQILDLKAQKHVTKVACENFKALLNSPSLKLNQNETLFAVVNDFNFCAKTALVVLDSSGEVCEVAEFNHLTLRINDSSSDSDQVNFKLEEEKLTELILKHSPKAFVIGTNTLQSVQLRRLFAKFSEQQVFMKSLEVPRVFAESQRSQMFRGYSELSVLAVSLGRLTLYPLEEVLGIVSGPNEDLLLSLNLHPVKSFISTTELEMVAVEAVANKGCDINYILGKPYLQSCLEFVPGLGPVRAQHLLGVIKESLLARTEMLQSKMLPEKIYQNAAGFIKVFGKDPLDSTRIHPYFYETAIMVARSALQDGETDSRKVVLKAMQHPEHMQELDLGSMSSKDLLRFVVDELTYPYFVEEPEFTEPSPTELLHLCLGEHSLKEGSVVEGMVVSLDETHLSAKVTLESGLEASAEGLSKEGLSKLNKGTSVRARVTQINARLQSRDLFFRVKLSLSLQDLKNHRDFLNLELDQAFVPLKEDFNDEAVMEGQDLPQKYSARSINHPKFRNIGFRTAEDELKKSQIGSYLFRPSSKGTDHLTCTWKFFDKVYSHLDIIEHDKPKENLLGKRFTIKGEPYESLDEIVDKYVKPCAKLIKESSNHIKFKTFAISQLQTNILNEKRNMSGSVPYYFTVTSKFPQYILLEYVPDNELITEYIKVKPKGLFFHEAYFRSLNELTSWFKQHHNDRNYKSQLSRAQAPFIDKRSHKIIPPTPQIHHEPTPARPNETPYDSTPRIGVEEWAAGGNLQATPVASDWQMSRNFESWKQLPPVPNTSWQPVDHSSPMSFGDCFQESSPKDTPSRRGRGGRQCYNCGESGHISKDCSKPSERKGRECYNCGESGHISRDCSKPSERGRRPRRGRGPRRQNYQGSPPNWEASGSSWESSAPQSSSWGSSAPQATSWGSSAPQSSSWDTPSQQTTSQSSSWSRSSDSVPQSSSWGVTPNNVTPQSTSWNTSNQTNAPQSSWAASTENTTPQSSSWSEPSQTTAPQSSSWDTQNSSNQTSSTWNTGNW